MDFNNFVFFVVTMALSLILRDFQASIGIKRFVFSINNLAPFIAAIICIIAFKNKRTQLAGLNFSIDIRVIERIILALILPLIIFIIGMMSFNRLLIVLFYYKPMIYQYLYLQL